MKPVNGASTSGWVRQSPSPMDRFVIEIYAGVLNELLQSSSEP